MKKPLFVLFALALVSSAASSAPQGPLYPPFCSVSPCDALGGVVICPDSPSPIPVSVVTVTVRDKGNNPLPAAAVAVVFGPGNLCLCPSMVYHAVTDNQGMATLTLRGGGCVQGQSDACLFLANGVIFRNFENVKSPDWDGTSGNCSVNLADFVRFAGGSDLCVDFHNVGGIDLSDIVTFISGFTPSHHCP